MLLACLAGAIARQPARASDDYTCEPVYALDSPAYGCSHTVLLLPGNDTRVNLALLLADRYGVDAKAQAAASQLTSPLFTWEEFKAALYPAFYSMPAPESEAAPNDDTHAAAPDNPALQAFADAIKTDTGLPPAERDALLALRKALPNPIMAAGEFWRWKWQYFDNHGSPECRRKIDENAAQPADDPASATAPGFNTRLQQSAGQLHSDAAQPWLAYLQGAYYFYQGANGLDLSFAASSCHVYGSPDNQWCDCNALEIVPSPQSLDRAATTFAALTQSNAPWVRETAQYMLGRIAVYQLQTGVFDEYGNLKPDRQGDAAAAVRARQALDAYLKAYPRGRYAKSAQGLYRRLHWLTDDRQRLTADYAAALAQSPADRMDDAALAEEIDNKLLLLGGEDPPPGPLPQIETDDPWLLAIMDLYAMRASPDANAATAGAGAHAPPQLKLAALQAQRPHFTQQPALFDYLLAVHALYVRHQPQAVLRLIPENAHQAAFSYLELSRQALRTLALRNIHAARPAAAPFHPGQPWLAMLPGARLPWQRPLLELAIAQDYETARAPGRIFSADSPVHSPELRAIELGYIAAAPLLRQQAKSASAPRLERDTALFVLLYKELSRGRYADFTRDVALVPGDATVDKKAWANYAFTLLPTQSGYGLKYGNGGAADYTVPLGIFRKPGPTDGYACPPQIKDTAARLAVRPGDVKGRLCVAEFLRLNGFDQFYLDTPPRGRQLGSSPSLFKGQPMSRLELYKTIMADRKASADDRAYALDRAVRCYAPGGNNSCGGVEVPLSQRKAWFKRLKARYPKSRWARDLQFYW